MIGRFLVGCFLVFVVSANAGNIRELDTTKILLEAEITSVIEYIDSHDLIIDSNTPYVSFSVYSTGEGMYKEIQFIYAADKDNDFHYLNCELLGGKVDSCDIDTIRRHLVDPPMNYDR